MSKPNQKGRRMTQKGAVFVKAHEVADYFNNHSKNLTNKQYSMISDLLMLFDDWDYCRTRLDERGIYTL